VSRSVRETMTHLPIKALYTIGELARASSLERRKLKRVLERRGVEFVVSGRVSYVALSELEVKVRPLWEGVQAAHALRGFTDE
jgi:hypothetical protein